MKTYNKFFISMVLLFIFISPSFAEKISMKISPIQVISTQHDEVEVGDSIKFIVVKNVFEDNKIYIAQNSNVIGVVDHVRQNGWGGDSAEIIFKTFYCKDVNNNKIKITYPLVINGKIEMANKTRDVANTVLVNTASFFTNMFQYTALIIRGAEIFIEPDTKIYNIFIEQ